jgi:hypothetical protein
MCAQLLALTRACDAFRNKDHRYKKDGMLFEQILKAGTAEHSTTTSPSTDNQMQEALTRAQQAINSTANEVSKSLKLSNLSEPETVASQLHNQTLSFARTVGQFVGQLQNEVSLRDDAVSSSEDVYQILKYCTGLDQEIFNTQHT